MKLHDLIRWLNANRARLHGDASHVAPLTGLLDASASHGLSPYSAFEVSLNSRRPRQFQVTYLHAYPTSMSGQKASDIWAMKWRAMPRSIEAMGAIMPDWPIDTVREVLLELRRWNSFSRVPSFSYEFDADKMKIVKTTLYAALRDVSCLDILRGIIDPAAKGKLKGKTGKDFDCLGIDFRPNASPALKLYELSEYDVHRIKNQEVWSRCQRIAERHRVRDLLFLRRIRSGRICAASKTVLRLSTGIPGAQMDSIEVLRPFRNFLSRIKPLLKRQIIYYIGFDNLGGLELSFRMTRAPWQTSSV